MKRLFIAILAVFITLIFNSCNESLNPLSKNNSPALRSYDDFLIWCEVQADMQLMGATEFDPGPNYENYLDQNQYQYIDCRYFETPDGIINEIYVWDEPTDTGFIYVQNQDCEHLYWLDANKQEHCDLEGKECHVVVRAGKYVIICCDVPPISQQ